MNWDNLSFVELERLHEVLGEYVLIRKQEELRKKLDELTRNLETLKLEADEVAANLTGQTELSARLRKELKLDADEKPSTRSSARRSSTRRKSKHTQKKAADVHPSVDESQSVESVVEAVSAL